MGTHRGGDPCHRLLQDQGAERTEEQLQPKEDRPPYRLHRRQDQGIPGPAGPWGRPCRWTGDRDEGCLPTIKKRTVPQHRKKAGGKWREPDQPYRPRRKIRDPAPQHHQCGL